MTGCTDCYKFNSNEALEIAKKAAKQKAIDTGIVQAVYQEANQYYYTNAEIARAEGFNIICFLSPHH
jgi:hypothetical protein